jgi:hypothetical protein
MAAGVASGEVVESGHHRVLDFFFQVGGRRPLAQLALEGFDIQLADFVGR